MATLQNTVFLGTNNTLTLPSGTTAQRPASPTEGMMRYNTTLGRAEIFVYNAWEDVNSGAGTTMMYVPLSGTAPGDITDAISGTVGTVGGTVNRNYSQSGTTGFRTNSGYLDIWSPRVQFLSGNPYWTIEFWHYDEGTGSGGSAQTKFEFHGYEVGLLYRFDGSTNNSYWRSNAIGFSATSTGSWKHHALVGRGSTIRQFINGTNVADTGGTPGESRWNNPLPSTSYLDRFIRIGASNHTTYSNQCTVGTFRKFKVSTVCRYESNFTSSSEYPL